MESYRYEMEKDHFLWRKSYLKIKVKWSEKDCHRDSILLAFSSPFFGSIIINRIASYYVNIFDRKFR